MKAAFAFFTNLRSAYPQAGNSSGAVPATEYRHHNALHTLP
jgi:hypothetical protein